MFLFQGKEMIFDPETFYWIFDYSKMVGNAVAFFAWKLLPIRLVLFSLLGPYCHVCIASRKALV